MVDCTAWKIGVHAHSCRGPGDDDDDDDDDRPSSSLSLIGDDDVMEKVTSAGRVSLLTKTMTTPPLCCRLQKLNALMFVLA
jgi:hypothetical protein